MPVRKPDALRILVDEVTARTAQETGTSELARLARLQRVTVEQRLDIPTRLSMVTKLGAWTPGEGKREIKQPKFDFADTGMARAPRRITDATFAIGNASQAPGWIAGELCRRRVAAPCRCKAPTIDSIIGAMRTGVRSTF